MGHGRGFVRALATSTILRQLPKARHLGSEVPSSKFCTAEKQRAFWGSGWFPLTSSVSDPRSARVSLKVQGGETVPGGWMIDRDGKPLTDPKRA